MFGRCFSIALLFLMVFASSLNAFQCQIFQVDTNGMVIGSIGWSTSGGKCSGCTGYICKNSTGGNVPGSACTEHVNEICQQGWDEAKIKSIAQETGSQSDNGKYFVFSCQNSICNNPPWFNEKMREYKKEIKDAGLSDESIDLGFPLSDCTSQTEAKRLNEMSNGLACPSGNPSDAKQTIACQNGVCKCWEGQSTEVACDNNPKMAVVDCDNLTEEQKGIAKEISENRFCPSTGYRTTVAPGAGAETIGNGFALLMAPLLASFFLL